MNICFPIFSLGFIGFSWPLNPVFHDHFCLQGLECWQMMSVVVPPPLKGSLHYLPYFYYYLLLGFMDPDEFHSCCYCQGCSEIAVYHNWTVLLAWLASGCTWQDDKLKNNSCEFSSTLLVTLCGAVFCYIMQKPATWQRKCITKYNSGGFKSLLFVTLSKGHFVTLCGKPPPPQARALNYRLCFYLK